MIYSYFPGCTLKNKAIDLDIYARRSAELLGITLEELPEWRGGERRCFAELSAVSQTVFS